MLAIVFACALHGLDALIVEVQVDFNPRATIPSFNIVGLPDATVKESKDRIKTAIRNTGRSSRFGGLSQTGMNLAGQQGRSAQEISSHGSGLQFLSVAT